jgi:hypothetical protein
MGDAADFAQPPNVAYRANDGFLAWALHPYSLHGGNFGIVFKNHLY